MKEIVYVLINEANSFIKIFMDKINILLSAIAAIAAVAAAIYSKKTFEYEQEPVLDLFHYLPYLYIGNIGRGIAKNIYLKENGIKIKSPKFYKEKLSPCNSIRESIKSGEKGVVIPLAYEIDVNSSGELTLNYENLKGKKFQSVFIIKKDSNNIAVYIESKN